MKPSPTLFEPHSVFATIKNLFEMPSQMDGTSLTFHSVTPESFIHIKEGRSFKTIQKKLKGGVQPLPT